MRTKKFSFKKRDGTKAKFIFVKPRGSVWYWDVPMETKGERASLPLPDVNLNQAKTLKECLALVSAKRGNHWVWQVVRDLLKCSINKGGDKKIENKKQK